MLQFLAKMNGKMLGNLNLRGTSRLTSFFHNEEKSNGECGTFMRKSLHDSLSRATMRVINADQWSREKEMIYPTRLEVRVN